MAAPYNLSDKQNYCLCFLWQNLREIVLNKINFVTNFIDF